MKKLLAMLMLFSAFAYSSEAHANDSTQTVTNEYFYIGYNIGASPVSHPEVGYRYQKDQFGLDAHFGVNAAHKLFFYSELGASFQYFIDPSNTDQTYLGLDLSVDVFSRKLSKWTTDWHLAPSILLGRDFTVANNNKLFGQVYYKPGAIQFDGFGWDWRHDFGFRIGYGF